MIDLDTLNKLISTHDISKLSDMIVEAQPVAAERAARLEAYAKSGDLNNIAQEAEALMLDANFFGMQRLSNRAIELIRTSKLANKGQAFLQCQAITRLIAAELKEDFDAIYKAKNS